MIKVSVIVPFYNVENYIEKCLNTLVNQTLEDIEIILVNDGSKDKSVEIVKKFMKEYPDKIVYMEKENGGLSDARNYAIPYARGEYIAFLDSDDYVELNMYKEMYELAKKENSDMVECDFYWEYENKLKVDVGEVYKEKSDMIKKVRVVAWNKLIRKIILDETKILFPKGLQYEDVEFTYKLLPYLSKISFYKVPSVHYIQREGSISKFQNERTKEIFEVLNHVIKYYKDKNLYNEYKMELEYIYARYAFCSSLLRIVRVKDKKVREELLNLTWKNVNSNFPDWKKNRIIRKSEGLNIRYKIYNLYMLTLNKFTYKIYSSLLSILY